MKLTEHGKNVYKEVRWSIDQFEQDILAGISKQEQLDAIHIMEDIRNNIIK